MRLVVEQHAEPCSLSVVGTCAAAPKRRFEVLELSTGCTRQLDHGVKALARSWAHVLDGHEIAPYDDDEIARLVALGITEPDEARARRETSTEGNEFCVA